MIQFLMMAGLLLTPAGSRSGATLDQSAPPLWATLKPGVHNVGYRQLDDSDSVVHVWYPRSGQAARLRFQDYLGNRRGQLAAFLSRTGMTQVTIDSLFASELYATAAGRPAGDAFPLVLVAQGNGQDAVDQAVLCEYLASHGFIVATTPSPMLRAPMEREDQVGEFAERQKSELAQAIRAVSAMLPVDTSRIAVVGHSFGARAALLLAMQDPRVHALISLDGGIGTATAVEAFRAAGSFRSDARLPPILHFYETLDAFMTPDFKLLRDLHTAGLILEPTRDMHHVHFTTYGFAAAIFGELAAATHATPVTSSAVAAVAEKTLAFLQQHLAASAGGSSDAVLFRLAPVNAALRLKSTLGITYDTINDQPRGWLRGYRRDEHGDWELIVDIIS